MYIFVSVLHKILFFFCYIAFLQNAFCAHTSCPRSFRCVAEESVLFPEALHTPSPHWRRGFHGYWLTSLPCSIKARLLFFLSFLFFVLRGWWRRTLCVSWVWVCEISFPNVELIPFTTLFKTVMWVWFCSVLFVCVCASTTDPPYLKKKKKKGNPGRQ